MKKIIIPLVLLITAAAAWYYFHSQKSVVDTNIFSGTVEATEVKISAEVPGKILEMTVDQGDKVEKGQMLIIIDTASLNAQLAQAKAARMAASGQVQAINAGIKNAKTNLGRSENLLGVGSISKQQYDSVNTTTETLEAQRRAAWGQVKQAEATGDYVQIQIDKATVTAPISGVVLNKNVEPGEMAMPGSPLVTLADLENCWVRVYIPETKLGHIKLGQKAKVYSDSFPNKHYEGKVTMIAGEAEFTPKNVQTKKERVRLVYAVKVTVPNPDQELKIGMPVDAVLWE